MSLERLLLSHKPSNWQLNNGKYDATIVVQNQSEEFLHVEELIDKSLYGGYTIRKVSRVQNSNFYCQFVCRREYLSRLPETYYSVRRFIQIPKHQLQTALTYNLDPRRLNLSELILTDTIQNIYDNIVLIVNVLSKCQHGTCTPARSTDYYIEYIVQF